jgi:prolyl-tRNA synthetase
VTIADRLSSEKTQIPLDEVAIGIRARLDQFQSALYARAEEFRREHTATVDSWDGLVAAVERGFAVMFHCGTASCEARIKKATAATPRVIPDDEPPATGVCAACGEASGYDRRIVFARAY